MISLSHNSRVFTLAALLILLDAGMALCQVVTGAISGRVTDTSRAVVPGAAIQIQNGDTGFSRALQTDREGRYVARNLPLGSFSVTAQQAGFRTEVRQGIVLTVASEVTVDLELSVGTTQETVEVTGEAPVIETTTSTVSGLVSPDQMRDLPLNGRSWDQLALLSPGVLANHAGTFNAAEGMGLRLSVNGGRADANLYLLDGTVVNDHSTQGPGSAAKESLGVEGILEFRLLTHNFSAEYGRNSGAVLSMVTRSGTNLFHGSAYEFVRNNVFDARNFFNPGALPPFRRNQFGASLGGHVIRDRIFFFANYEGLRQRQGNTVIASVPDVNARRGLFPDPVTHVLGPVPLSPLMVPYLTNVFPLPNGPNFGDGTAQFISNFPTPVSEDYAMERMDFRVSDKDSFYWRYVFDASQNALPRPVATFEDVTSGTNHFVVLSETHIFSGASLNEFRFAYNRTYPHDIGQSVKPLDPSLSFIPGQLFGTFSFSSASGSNQGGQLSATGNDSHTPHSFAQNLFQETDTFSVIRGAHSLKFGADLERIQNNNSEGDPIKGIFTFGGLLSLLAAQPSRFDFMLLGGYSTNSLGWRRSLFGWFIQDDYRLRPNLTLNLGLRHEFFTSPTEVNGRSGNLRQITDAKSTIGPPFESPKANFAPRVGLAWDPTGTGKTSVRVGAGVFYNHVDGRTWYSNADSDATANRTSFSVFNPPFPHGSLLGASPQLLNTYTVQYHLDTPTVVQYNFEIQRQILPSISLRAGYVGSYGYHMVRATLQNIVTAQILPDGSKSFPANAPVANPNFADIVQILTDAHSNYNAFQLVLQKSLSLGLRFQVSYTLSKALSNADTDGESTQISSTSTSTMDIRNLARDYSLSAYDQRQTLVLNGQYQMPWDKRLKGRMAKAVLGGWAMNGIFSFGSGLPFNIQDGFNRSQNGDSFIPDRPNLAPGASNNPIHGVSAGCTGVAAGQKLGTPNRYYDPCAFQLPPAGTFGNLGRNTVTGPHLYDTDLTLVKSTPVTEKIKLEFRAEFFNLFNHANFALPTRTIFNSKGAYNGNDGVITSTTTDGRQIQLGMKLTF